MSMSGNEQKDDMRSLVTLAVTMFIFGSIGVLRRFIPLSSGMLALTRGLLGGTVLFFVILAKEGRRGGGDSALSEFRKRLDEVGRKDILTLFAMGAGIGINWMLMFESYNYTTVSVATLCYYMEPTILILSSPFVFGEKLTARKLICSAAAVLGMFMISGVFETGIEGLGGSHVKGIALALLAAVLYAFEVIMNKKKSYVDPFILTMIELFGAAAIMLPYVMMTDDIAAIRLTGTEIVLVLAAGIIVTGIAYAMYFGSMKKLRTQTIALFSYIDPITALLLSAVILGERMTMFGMIGSVLILGATAIGQYESKK